MDAEELREAHAAADAAYEPFASIDQWRQEPVALGSWDDAAGQLAEARRSSPVETVNAVLDEVLRAAAVDTGAIEGLYRTDRGFTMSVARNVISLDQAEVEAGAGFRGSFEAQLEGFEHAVRLATEDRPLTEADIRDLHRITCAEQTTYRVQTPAGVQERRLVTGRYKTEPNHVQRGDSSWHSYAPTDDVPVEMHRLVDEVGSYAFSSSPAVVQAAFVHHAFTSIHPFPDGNGRVARLLASIPLVRAASIPLWVEDSDKDVYLDALREADRGNRQPFLRLVTSLSLGLMRTLSEALPRTPRSETPDEVACRVAMGVIASIVQAAADGTSGSIVMHPAAGLNLNRPGGVVQPRGEQVLLFGVQDPPINGRVVVVDVDPAADEWSRILVATYDRPLGGRVVDEHRFQVDELHPSVRAPARRRLEAIARGVVDAVRADAQAQR